MADDVERKCPDCGREMHEIKLIDQADKYSHEEMVYTVPEAKRGLWLGQFPIKGRVLAWMCDQCGRIALYGAPRKFVKVDDK